MKTAVYSTAFAAAVMAAQVSAHGQMLKPEVRPVSATYRANCGALKNAGDSELQWAPVENLAGRTQADMPAAPSFNLYNGCRGFVYEKGNTVTTLAPGAEFDLEYFIQAPHPGYMNLSIVKPETTGGKITYVRDVSIANYDNFAQSGGTFTISVKMPSTVTGCEAAGDCALQFYWHSDIANQTYPSCADIIVSGSGASTTTETSAAASESASAATTTDEASTAASEASSAAEASPSPTDDEYASSAASEASTAAEASASTTDDEYSSTAASTANEASIAGEYSTAASTTDDETTAPAATTAAPSIGSDSKCNVRRRRRN